MLKKSGVTFDSLLFTFNEIILKRHYRDLKRYYIRFFWYLSSQNWLVIRAAVSLFILENQQTLEILKLLPVLLARSSWKKYRAESDSWRKFTWKGVVNTIFQVTEYRHKSTVEIVISEQWSWKVAWFFKEHYCPARNHTTLHDHVPLITISTVKLHENGISRLYLFSKYILSYLEMGLYSV